VPKTRGWAISRAQAESLWGASAGRCNICNASLLRDGTTGVEVKAGEKAHIIGIGDSPRSPRSQEAVGSLSRNETANLILLCGKHHREVDARPDVYTSSYLLQLKRRHEERIFYLTSLSEEKETLVLRLEGMMHGGKVPDFTREQAREVLLREEGRYPRFRLSATEHDISIDLRDLAYDDGSAYWAEVKRRIGKRVAHLNELRREGDAGHISVFALALIPVLVMLGDALGDASDITVYHRRNHEGWGWSRKAELPTFEMFTHKRTKEEDVVLTCSLSASVRMDRIPEGLRGLSVYEIRPESARPSALILDHPDALQAFGQVYRSFLSMLEDVHPGVTVVHLLPAVQGDAAILLGQVRTPAVNPPLRVYDLVPSSDEYIFACEVGR
jgi:hypothetical protein